MKLLILLNKVRVPVMGDNRITEDMQPYRYD